MHVWVPGVTAVVVFVLCALFGLVAEGWATAAVMALLFAGGGWLAAHALHLLAAPVLVLFAGLGLFVGMVNHKRLSVVLPPLFCAAFVSVGAAICWAPNWRGSALWQLNDLDWVLGLAGVVAVILLALSLEREHRKKLRLAVRTRRMDDELLKKQIEAKKAAYRRASDQANKLDS